MATEETATKIVYKKLVDRENNQYMFEVAPDVDISNARDVLEAHEESLAKLIAYKLHNEPWQDLKQNLIGPAAARFSHPSYKIQVTDIPQEEFGTKMAQVISVQRDRNDRLANKGRVTHYQGAKIQQDEHGHYVEREQQCHAAGGCPNTVKGTQRLGVKDGKVMYAQTFTPYDKAAKRVREGSKYFLCPTCSPKRVSPDEAQYAAQSGAAVRQDGFIEGAEAGASAIYIPNIPKGMDFDLQMGRLTYLTNAKTDSALAGKLGVTPFTLHGWKHKKSVSAKVIWEFCYINGYCFDWVMLGEGVPRLNTLKSIVEDAISRPVQTEVPEPTLAERIAAFTLDAPKREKVEVLALMADPLNGITGDFFKGFAYNLLPDLLKE